MLNKINGKRYIGSAVDIFSRWRLHKHKLEQGKHHNRHLQRAYVKYGIEAFSFEIIEEVAKELLLVREQFFMEKFNSSDREYGYNICPIAGSSLGVKRTEKFKRIISARRGELNPRFGVKLSEETKKKCSLSKIGSKNPMYGKEFSPEHKAKLKAANDRRGGCPNKGKKGELCPLSMPIKQIKDGVVIREWSSVSDVKRELGYSTAHISEVANGKRKSAYGFQWEYLSCTQQ